MIAVISDLHLQHTATEVIRHRDGDVVWETGVRRNVPPDAVGLVFEELRETAEDRGSREVHLVLAGDVFECHRTPLWFEGPDAALRPSDAPGPDGSPLCAKTLRVLDAVEAENATFFETLRAEAAKGAGRAKIVLHYLPGNHDRLVGLWPSTRARVRRILGLGDDDGPFPRVLDWSAWGGGAGVRVRHGHEYDAANIGLREGVPDYAAPAIGDFVTIDIAARFAMAFRVRHARALRRPDTEGKRLRGLYTALTEFDDVRPASHLAPYLTERAGAHRAEVLALLRPVLADVYATTTRDRFFSHAARARGMGPLFEEPISTLLTLGIAGLPTPLLARVIGRVARLDSPDPGDKPALAAAREEGLGDRIHTIVAGHTHRPTMECLPGTDNACWYVNSGTWRMRVARGVGGYGRLRAGTMVFCFDAAEAARTPDLRRVETWTGLLTGGRLGAYTEVVAPSAAPTRLVRVHAVDWLPVDGVRRRPRPLEIGVDGASATLTPDGMAELPADPDLDGEVWARVVPHSGERDEGLPWGVDHLPREPGSRAYTTGERQVCVCTYDRHGARVPLVRVGVRVE